MRKYLILAIVLTLSSFAKYDCASSETINVLWVLGQSNALQQGYVDDVPENKAYLLKQPTSVRYFLNEEERHFGDFLDPKGQYRFGVEILGYFSPPSENWWIIKTAVGAAGIIDWMPNQLGTGGLYESSKNTVLSLTKGKPIERLVVVLINGENECWNKIGARLYFRRLKAMVRLADRDVPHVHFDAFIWTLSYPIVKRPHTADIIQHQCDMALIRSLKVETFSTFGAAKRSDLFHYDTNGIIYLVERFRRKIWP